MMDLYNSLMTLGSSGGAAQAAPTDMSQIKVPQQAMDLSGVTQAANSQLQYDPNATPGTDWGAIGMGALGGMAGSMGGRQQKPGGLMQPKRFDGRGQEHEMVAGSALSGAKTSDASPLFKNGLMGI